MKNYIIKNNNKPNPKTKKGIAPPPISKLCIGCEIKDKIIYFLEEENRILFQTLEITVKKLEKYASKEKKK